MKYFVFVHGTLRRGQGLNPVLERGGAKYITSDYLVHPSCVLVALSKSSYPAVVVCNARWQRGITYPYGDLYEVDAALLGRLDSIEGVPSFYDRFDAHMNVNTDISKYIKETGRRQTSDVIRVSYYGMHHDNRCLQNGTIITNGDWCNPTWGETFTEWTDRCTLEDEEAAMRSPIANQRWQPPGIREANRHIEWGGPDENEEQEFIDTGEEEDDPI